MNCRFATAIASLLAELGVRRVCLSPGSRSSSLAAAVGREPRLEKRVHFDERAMAFYAHGYAKATQNPVAIITTSGSAVGNLFPAVMEAALEGVPLLIITADRPIELQGCMANQTCDQVKFFGDYVRHFVQIPAFEPQLPGAWLARVLSEAVFLSKHPPAGPVHINCQFREPFSFNEKFEMSAGTVHEKTHATLGNTAAKKWAETLASYEKGMIVAGSMPTCQKKSVLALAEALDWPILADLMSGLRSCGIPYYHDILKLHPDLKPECVLHLGDRVVIPHPFTPEVYLMVADHPQRCDPQHRVTHRIAMDPSTFCEELLPFLSPQTSWQQEWKERSSLIEENLTIPSFSEPGAVRYLHDHLPSHFAIYFSNSMPVRDANRFFFPQGSRIFCQRGLSGIDGNIATAIGLAEGAGTPLVAVLGDLAALHDINALAMLKTASVPVILLIINNGGGGIFSFLPVREQKDVFEAYQAASHGWEFSHAAHLFDVPYLKLSNLDQLGQALQSAQSMVIEFPSNREENLRIHKAIDEKLAECKTSFLTS